MVGKDFVHLASRFKPFLLCIEHAGLVVQVFVGCQTNEAVVGLAVFFVNEVAVVGANQFDMVFLREFLEFFVDLFLQGIGVSVGTDGGVFDFMAHKLQVIVVAKDFFIPEDGFVDFLGSGFHDFLRDFAAKACRTDNEPFVVFFEVGGVGARTHIETVDP